MDFTDLSAFEPASFSAIFAPCNVIDVMADDGRRRLLSDLRRLLEPGGLLAFSSHNLGFEPNLPRPWNLPRGNALSTGKAVALLPRRTRNHLRLRRFEHRGPDHIIRNDASHDYSTLLYFIDRDAQERQLEACGLELLECLDLDARPVPPGDPARDRVELHYLARPAASDGR
jgi:SAM-dependent methyltransferase